MVLRGIVRVDKILMNALTLPTRNRLGSCSYSFQRLNFSIEITVMLVFNTKRGKNAGV